MITSLSQPMLRAFLSDAMQHPDDDTPRLILADWLQEQGDEPRAEFIRTQCRLASDGLTSQERLSLTRHTEELLTHYGGGWLGPLWRWPVTDYSWHRGLLALYLHRRASRQGVLDMLDWIDTLHVEIPGQEALCQLQGLLQVGAVNHLGLTFLRFTKASTLLDGLRAFPEQPILRTLSLCWVAPVGRRPAWVQSTEGVHRPIKEFLTLLLTTLPLTKHLTHLAVIPTLSMEETMLVRELGITLVEIGTSGWLDWMHQLPATSFCRSC